MSDSSVGEQMVENLGEMVQRLTTIERGLQDARVCVSNSQIDGAVDKCGEFLLYVQDLQSQANREIVQRNRDMMEAKRLQENVQRAKAVEGQEQRDKVQSQDEKRLQQMVEDLREASVLVADTCNSAQGLTSFSTDFKAQQALRGALNTIREGSDLFQSRIEQLEKKDGQQDGWHSSLMAYHLGTDFWATADGGEVEATSVGVAPTRWKDHFGVVPWDDAKSIGPVTRWLRKGRPSRCSCEGNHDCRTHSERESAIIR